MIRDSRNFFQFTTALENRIAKLTVVALNPSTPQEQTQSARVRLHQLQEVLSLANGETAELK